MHALAVIDVLDRPEVRFIQRPDHVDRRPRYEPARARHPVDVGSRVVVEAGHEIAPRCSIPRQQTCEQRVAIEQRRAEARKRPTRELERAGVIQQLRCEQSDIGMFAQVREHWRQHVLPEFSIRVENEERPAARLRDAFVDARCEPGVRRAPDEPYLGELSGDHVGRPVRRSVVDNDHLKREVTSVFVH